MMEHLPENSAAQGDQPPEMPVASGMVAASLGKTLREARERLGLSVADVAAQIKFAPRQIEALEADNFKHLPEMAFVRGFVRSYAKILKLDAHTLLATLVPMKEVSGELPPASVEVPFPDAHLTQRQNLVWLGLALLLAVLVVAFAVRNYTATPVQDKVTRVETPVSLPAELPAEVQIAPDADGLEPDAPPPQPAGMKAKSPEAIGQPPARATKPSVPPSSPQKQLADSVIQPGASAQPGVLRLEFDTESWVEIKDRDGNILSSQIYQPGSDLRLEGNAPFSLLIGHAPLVRLYYRDKQVDLAPHTRRSSEVAHLTLE